MQAYIQRSAAGYQIWQIEKVSLFGTFTNESDAIHVLNQSFSSDNSITTQATGEVILPSASEKVARKRGPKPGTKRKAASASPSPNGAAPKRGGRPKGSKNKPKDGTATNPEIQVTEVASAPSIPLPHPRAVIVDTTAEQDFDDRTAGELPNYGDYSETTQIGESRTAREVAANW